MMSTAIGVGLGFAIVLTYDCHTGHDASFV